MFNFKKERLVKDSIGEGSFGEVFPYQKNSQDYKWVVKRIKAKKIEDLLRCLPEIVLGFSCDHPCIVPVKGYSIEPKDNKYYVYMKLPRMSGGNLADELRRRSKKDLYFSQEEVVKHFYALVSAVDYLHSKRISHCDIKINNILLDEKGNLKLCDIGSGKYVADDDHYNTMTLVNGAVNYKAPEIIQHERAYNLKSKNEKKEQPMENILKREHLYLADSWSLGLTILKICTLDSTLIDPYQSVQVIEEMLQKLKKEASTRYQDALLEIVFDLLKTDPTQRLQVSAVKAKLEEKFNKILPENLKASAGLQKQDRQAAPDFSNYFKAFHEKADEIVKVFEDDKKAKDYRLDRFEETFANFKKKLDTLNVGIEKIKAEKKQELEEISKRYEDSIQALKQENLALLEKIKNQDVRKVLNQLPEGVEEEKRVLPRNPRDEIAYQKKLDKVSAELAKKWSSSGLLKFKSQPHLSVVAPKPMDDKIVKDITQDIVRECSKEDLWEELEELELVFGFGFGLGLLLLNHKMTDEGLKTFASLLGAKVSNLRLLKLNIDCWVLITDDGLTEFANQFVSRLTNVQHLELGMHAWRSITDKGLEAFVSQLALKLTNVEHLVLDFGSWDQISDRGLKVLAAQLGPKLVNVKHFTLSIQNWTRITDEGFKVFASQLLPNLAHASEFKLFVGGCRNLTDEGLKVLVSQFGPNLAKIKSLVLDFNCLEKATSKSLDVLADQIIQNLTNIEELTLDLQGLPWFKQTDEQNLRNKLKKIPKLTIYNSRF